MMKIHPNFSDEFRVQEPPEVLTIWRKSLIFTCNGFTVFDSRGNLVYRVDNYANTGEIFLMDAAGNAIFTIRRRKLSLADWGVYDGETTRNPLFILKKNVNFLGKKCIAEASVSRNRLTRSRSQWIYKIEGCYMRRCCGVYDHENRLVAEIEPKESSIKGVSLGKDIFRLVVRRELIDSAAAMALVILLDQMFRSSNRRRFFSSSSIRLPSMIWIGSGRVVDRTRVL